MSKSLKTLHAVVTNDDIADVDCVLSLPPLWRPSNKRHTQFTMIKEIYEPVQLHGKIVQMRLVKMYNDLVYMVTADVYRKIVNRRKDLTPKTPRELYNYHAKIGNGLIAEQIHGAPKNRKLNKYLLVCFDTDVKEDFGVMRDHYGRVRVSENFFDNTPDVPTINIVTNLYSELSLKDIRLALGRGFGDHFDCIDCVETLPENTPYRYNINLTQNTLKDYLNDSQRQGQCDGN